MSFQGVDPWRWQYFEGVTCPSSVTIPVDDPTGWRLFPDHRKIYNKLFVCETQGIPAGPHGVLPRQFPVFSKPIINLHGMGAGGRLITSVEEFDACFTPGHMWMRLLTGRHISTDLVLVDGRACWWRHSVGKPLPAGMFDYWEVLAGRLPRLEAYCGAWVRRTLPAFTGIVNLETIGGRIIECHLRLSEQWVDLNGPGWLESIVELYTHGRWHFVHRPVTGYSVILFGPHGFQYAIDTDAVNDLRARPGVSSIQITFDPGRPVKQHAMPPGGFRIAIVNCWDLRAGLAVRDRLKRLFRASHLNGEDPAAFHPDPHVRKGPLRGILMSGSGVNI